MCVCEIKILSRLNLVEIFNVIALYILFSFSKQECIPVGCITTAAVARHPPPPPSPRADTPPWADSLSPAPHPHHIFLSSYTSPPLHHTSIYNTSPVNRMTHACENITFLRYAVGNNQLPHVPSIPSFCRGKLIQFLIYFTVYFVIDYIHHCIFLSS